MVGKMVVAELEDSIGSSLCIHDQKEATETLQY